MATFRELFQASIKSADTEEWFDAHFNHPIGLVFALFWNKLGVHPNVITILSFFLGAGAGLMFSYTDWPHNVMGIVLLMLANFAILLMDKWLVCRAKLRYWVACLMVFRAMYGL